MVERRDLYDGALYMQCLWCFARWHRFEKGDPLRAIAEQVIGEGD